MELEDVECGDFKVLYFSGDILVRSFDFGYKDLSIVLIRNRL
jgi:hypothetical protein